MAELHINARRHVCPAAAVGNALEYNVTAILPHRLRANELPSLFAILVMTGAKTDARFGPLAISKYCATYVSAGRLIDDSVAHTNTRKNSLT